MAKPKTDTPHDGECGKYELLKTHEDGDIRYQVGDVLEFNCEEAAFLKSHGVIWQLSDKPITRKRLVQSACAGCGSTLVNVADPAVAATE